MKEKDKHVHIGVIGCVDHSKMTLSYAIQKALENKNSEEQPSEYPYNLNIEIIKPAEKTLKLKKQK